MNILSIETSHQIASVALMLGDSVIEKKICSEKRHEETVMPAVCELMEEQGIAPEDLDLIAVDIGPGSFTGIRIGICHANAIADAASIPCIGICALEAMAFARDNGQKIAAMIDAGNDNCYGAIYGRDITPLCGPLADTVNGFYETVKSAACDVLIKDTEGNSPSARTIACVAAVKAADIMDKSTRAQPLYLRQSQAERKRRE